MKDESIRRPLKQLHDALKGVSSTTGEDRELLKQLSADIEALLALPHAMSHAEHQSIIDRLRVALVRFEVSHPDLTATMAQVNKALGDMGI